MDNNQLQELLPPGLVIQAEIPNCQFPGRSYEAEDQRFPGESIKRVISFFDHSNADDWKPKWKQDFSERLRILTSTPMRHVVRPLEATHVDGFDYVITDQRDATIKSLMHVSGNQTDKSELFKQLLEGIKELHRLDIVHGAICSDHVQHSRHKNNEVQCQLISAEWGLMHFWSKDCGQEINNELKKYYPPEWVKGPEGTREGDVYAAGIIACELFADTAKIGDYKKDTKVLRKELKLFKTPTADANLICNILDRKIQIAATALDALRSPKAPLRKLLACTVAAGFVLGLLTFWLFSNGDQLKREIETLNKTVARRNEDNETITTNNQSLKGEHTILNLQIEAQKAEMERLRKMIKDNGNDPTIDDEEQDERVNKEIDRIWNSVYNSPTTTLSGLADDLAKLEKDTASDIRAGVHRGLKVKLNDFLQAAKYWHEIANDPNMKFLQMSGAASRAQKAGKLTTGALVFVDQWIGDYESMSRKKWKIRLGKATYTNGKYKGREMWVEVDGEDVKVPEFDNEKKLDHHWGDAAWADYSKIKPPQTITVSVPKDKSIALLMEVDDYYLGIPITTNMINREHSICTGPVAMWRFHMKGMSGGIKNKDEGVELRLRVDKCPGPRWEITNSFKPKGLGNLPPILTIP
jgi:serine/threonine protein kinase